MAFSPLAAFFSSSFSEFDKSSAIAAMNACVGSSPTIARNFPLTRQLQARFPCFISIKFDGFISSKAASFRWLPAACAARSISSVSVSSVAILSPFVVDSAL